jgi:CubicO group peptidase (beta-lactamase class C family)
MVVIAAQAGVERKRRAFALSFPRLAPSFTQLDLILDELNHWLIKQVLIQPLQSPPGKRFAYSNMGYTLAGRLIERIARGSGMRSLSGVAPAAPVWASMFIRSRL